MAGYATKQERIAVEGVDDILIRSLQDRLQFFDPNGDAARLGISSATWPLFGLLWPSGGHLAARIASRPVSATERILEIGCGLALASLVSHRRGADITASDHHPLAETFLEENLRANALGPLKYRHGHWGPPPTVPGRPDAPIAAPVAGQFDLIIGSDVLYEPDPRGDLAHFIDTHAAAAAEVWIVDPDRGNRALFNRNMAGYGFRLREEPLRYAATANADAYKGRMLTYRRST
jgi:predicted nicotinamide N-methyase